MPAVVLETHRLRKRYADLVAVDDLTVQVYQGEIFGLLGPNGAGKTTSIHMMCGLIAPDAGEVLIQGVPVKNNPRHTRTRVGMCPQNTIFWEKLTCLEQLEFIGEMYSLPRKAARRRGAELLEILELTNKRHSLAGTLSGGMQRRLNLALALVHDPEILVLDEPEAGLDPQSRVLVREFIRSMARNKTIILTTHNMDEADRLADRVAIIDYGHLLVLDTPEALKRSVGEGDVLEIGVFDVPVEQISSALQALGDEVSTGGRVITLRRRGIVEHLPEILHIIRTAGGRVGEVHLRANSLEDVFIALTGRRLRQ